MKTISVNKKAYHNYFLTDETETGISLLGSEVKSIRNGHISLAESFVKITSGGEAFLHNAYIKPYENAGAFVPDSKRARKLLMHKKQILNFKKKAEAEGYTIVPIKVYINQDGKIKLQIALGKGKKLYDKREVLKKRTVERNIQRYKTI